MSITELVVTSHGFVDGREKLVATGKRGETYASIEVWIAAKKVLGIDVVEITRYVDVIGVNRWVAYAEGLEADRIDTVFEVANDRP